MCLLLCNTTSSDLLSAFHQSGAKVVCSGEEKEFQTLDNLKYTLFTLLTSF